MLPSCPVRHSCTTRFAKLRARVFTRILLNLTILVPVAAQSALVPPFAFDGFARRHLEGRYYSESADVGDFDRDGKLDIVSGPYWYAGPSFTKRFELFKPTAFPVTTFASQFFVFTLDVDRDGWDDVVTIGSPGSSAHWLKNPRSLSSHWAAFKIGDRIGNESPRLVDLVGDARPELVCFGSGRVGYFAPDPTSATKPWRFRDIANLSGITPFIHGLGVGDLNGDGRKDYLTAYGWFEQPKSTTAIWPFHPASFGSLAGGAQIEVFDVDGDGDADVVASMTAHGYGLSWFENTGNARSFRKHVILSESPAMRVGGVQFSQLHGLAVADMNGDGLPDIVTGKTWLAHNGTDPGAKDPPVVYWFRLDRRGGVRFHPEFVSSDAGIGRRVVVRDLNGDKRPDIVVGNKLGVTVLQQR